MQFAARVLLVALHRPQFGSRRAAVNVLLRLVDEVFQGEATLLRQAIVLLGFRHIGDDPVCFARPQHLAIVVADIGRRLQRLDAEGLFRRHRHRVELAGIVAIVDHFAGNDQLVFAVNRDLHVVASNYLPILRQQSGVGIGAR